MMNWEFDKTPFMKRSEREDIRPVIPSVKQVDGLVRNLSSAMKKATTIEEKCRIKRMVDEFIDLKEML
jgi:hypothetical protein